MTKKAYAKGQKQQKQGLKAADHITSKRLAKYFSEKQLDFTESRKESTPCRRSWNMFTFPQLYSWMSEAIASQQVFTRLPRIQIRWWLPCFPGSLKWNLVKTALSLSTEMELTSGLYLIIFAMVSWLYQKVQHFWKNLQTDEAEFYQIQGILEKLKTKAPKNFEELVILTNEEHRIKLHGWLSQYRLM